MSITAIRESGQAKGTGKRWTAKLISADVWGSTAYYPAEVLARDAAFAFPAGTKMFENHLTESEQWERPVGDVNKLVGKLVTAGEFIADHPEGPGVYADVEFYDSYVPRISEIGNDVGLSVDGGADYVEGERDQRYGKIVTGIPFIRSVDVVVAAGAGGKLITIKESAGPMAGVPVNKEGDQSMSVTKEELTEALKAVVSELDTKITQIRESLTPTPVAAATPAAPAEPAAATSVLSAEEIAAAVAAKQAEDAAAAAAAAAPAEPVQVDVAALVEAIATAQLPTAVIPGVVASVQNGASVEDAVKQQTDIREAFLAQTGSAGVRIVESGRGQGDQPVGSAVLSALNPATK